MVIDECVIADAALLLDELDESAEGLCRVEERDGLFGRHQGVASGGRTSAHVNELGAAVGDLSQDLGQFTLLATDLVDLLG